VCSLQMQKNDCSSASVTALFVNQRMTLRARNRLTRGMEIAVAAVVRKDVETRRHYEEVFDDGLRGLCARGMFLD
jgi:hypothetical protein